MYPPTRRSLDDPISRKIRIDMGDGEEIEMDWDKPGNPTQSDVRDWVQKRREHPVPTTPEPIKAPVETPPKSVTQSIEDSLSSYGHSLWDSATGMASGISKMYQASRGDPMAAMDVFEGYKQAGKEFMQAGPVGKAAIVGEQLTGAPIRDIGHNLYEGNYSKAAGEATIPALLMAAGGGLLKGKKAAIPEPIPEAPIPKPVIPEPTVEPTPQIRPQEAIPEFAPSRQVTPEVSPEPADVLNAAAQHPEPAIAKAAQQTSLLQRAKKAAQDSSLARMLADMGKSGMSVIKSSGEAGPDLAKMLTKARLDAEYQAGDWITRAKEITKDLTPEQVDAYVEARDTGTLPNDPAVLNALEGRKLLDQEVVQKIQDTGAGFKTASGKKIVPFRERLNYWPHIYPKEFFRQAGSAVEALMKDGMSYEEASAALKNAGKFGERLISAQHERQSNAPGYRRDLEADYLHLNDMANRTVQAREFGPLDIADPNSPISKLIKGTAEPGRIGELVSRHLGRDAPPNAAWAKGTKALTTAETAMHLSQFAISNMSQLATIPLRSNATAFAKALGKTLSGFKSAEGAAEGTGALQTIHQDLLREIGGEGFLSKAFGMKRSETFNRTVAALSGKGTAEDLFAQLKKNPTNARAKARLENLLLEPSDKVLSQEALTPEQLGRAGGRMAEITQGRAQTIDLPKLWSDHPALQLMMLYKKYAFRQSAIIRDALMENPARNIPAALALYSLMGEGVGDLKAGIKGGVSGQGVAPAIASRGEDASKNLQALGLGHQSSKVAGRIASNLGQSWALGLLADALESSQRGPEGLKSFALGPVVGDVAEIAGAAATRNKKALGKKAASAIPLVGTGLAARMGQKKKTSGLPPLPGVRLPKLPSP